MSEPNNIPQLPASASFKNFDPARLPSPCFVVDEIAIENNLRLLADVQARSGARILLALKAFSMFSLAPLISQYLSGTCSSGLFEARLGRDKFGGEQHVYSAAFAETDLSDILGFADHLVLNSLSQWQRFQTLITEAQVVRPNLNIGLRINPEHSEGTKPLYDPCAPGSRLGVPLSRLKNTDLSMFSGLHFHTLCEQGFAPLDRTLAVVEQALGDRLGDFDWINLGGGHHITHPDYDVEALITRLTTFAQRYDVQVYLEPGEAIAINTGVLITEVLDIISNKTDIAILDCSATCHMPDTLEMPYRAHVVNSAPADEFPYTYRLGGLSCLAGDVMGDYSFEHPLQVGQRLIFDDMSHYTMVKTTTFNGVKLPAIAIWNSESDDLRVVREFAYEDFLHRLS